MIRFLKALEEDAEAIVGVQLRAFAIDVDICGEGPPGYDSIDRQIQLIKSSIYYKIVDESMIIGGFYIYPQGSGRYDIVRLFVDPPHQGKGIGSMALKFIETLFDDLEILELEASDFREDNHTYYEHRGFCKVGKVMYSEDGFSYKYQKMFICRKIDYIVEWATEEDAKELGMVHSSSWKIAYKGIVPDEVLEGITAEGREAYFARVIRNKSEETAVIKAAGDICGFVTLGSSRDEDLSHEYGEIWGIYLSPEYWKQGIGSILLDWAKSELKNRGFSKISLWVLEENNRACRFYEKHGFVFDGTIKRITIGKDLNEKRYTRVI